MSGTNGVEVTEQTKCGKCKQGGNTSLLCYLRGYTQTTHLDKYSIRAKTETVTQSPLAPSGAVEGD